MAQAHISTELGIKLKVCNLQIQIQIKIQIQIQILAQAHISTELGIKLKVWNFAPLVNATSDKGKLEMLELFSTPWNACFPPAVAMMRNINVCPFHIFFNTKCNT